MNVRQVIVEKIEKTKVGRRLIREQQFRVIFSASVGLLINILYAFYHGMLGLMNQSLWFVAMGAYYVVLGAMRFSAVLCEWRGRSAYSEDAEYFVVKLCGGMLILMGFLLTSLVYISLAQNIAVKHDEIVMIIIATYSFYKITAAVIRAIKQRRNNAPLLIAIRTIGYAEVAASLLTLQRSMLVSFGSMDAADMAMMNRLTGMAVCLFIWLLGIFTMRKGRKRRKKRNGTV